MIKNNVMRTLARTNAFVTAAILVAAALLPAVMLSGSASGAQLIDRFIDMSASQTSENPDNSVRDRQKCAWEKKATKPQTKY